MLWLALELLLGVVLFVGIVWWTLPRRKRPDPRIKTGPRRPADPD